MANSLRRRRARRSLSLLLAVVFVLSLSATSCRPPNLPESVRWWLFSNFGAEKMCPELLKRSMTLRLSDRANGIGRFFPTGCTYNVDDSARTVTVHISGTGYGYMPPARRVGFSIQTSVEYRPDFWFVDDDVYVWAKLNRIVQGPNFQLGYVENPVVDVAANVPPFGSIANFVGDQVVKSQMTQGFTVVRNLDTESDSFSLGILMPPNKPFTPFDVSESDYLTFANETVDVYAGQRDYLGPFEIADTDQELLFRATIMGPDVEMLVVQKSTGDLWRESFQTGRPSGQPPGPVLSGAPLPSGQTVERRLKLAPGLYYVVIDNSAETGMVNPPVSILNAMMGTATQVSYLAQLVE